MKRLLSLTMALALAATPAFAQGRKEDSNKKRQATASQSVKSAARNTGQAVRNVGRSTGQLARATGASARNVVRNTGSSARNVVRNSGERVGSVARNTSDRTRSVVSSASRAVRQPVVSNDVQRSSSTAVVRQPTQSSRVVTSDSFRSTARSDSDRRDWDRSGDRDRDRDNRWDRDGDRGWSRYRYYHPPTNIFRSWDRGRSYSWNNHRYHWYGDNWVIIDPGYAYSGPYYDSTLSVIGTGTVALVQDELARLGYDPGPADGVAGYRTRNAIAQFQRDNGLYVTGTINRSLLNALDIG